MRRAARWCERGWMEGSVSISGIQGLRDSGIQGFRDSGIQGFRDSGLAGAVFGKAEEVHGEAEKFLFGGGLWLENFDLFGDVFHLDANIPSLESDKGLVMIGAVGLDKKRFAERLHK